MHRGEVQARSGDAGSLWVRHRAAGLAAFAVSLLLHSAVFRWAPSLPIGRVGAADALPRYKSVVVESVRVRPDRVERRDAAELEPRISAGPSGPGMPVPADMFVPERMPASLTEPFVANAAVERAFAPADIYEDIIRIQDALVDEKPAALPRKPDPGVARRGATPDIKLPAPAPVKREDDIASPPGPSQRPAEAADVVRLGDIGGMFGGMSDAAGSGSFGAGVPPDETRMTARPMEDVVALDVRACRPPNEETVYFEINIRPARDNILPVLGRDILLIQDVSESMTQAKVVKCREGWMRWLTSMNPGDRFDVMEFREDVRTCFGEWTEVNPVNLAKARTFVGEMSSRGDTDLLRSLEAVLSWPASERRPVLVILASDGRPTAGIVDSSAIIARFTMRNAGARSVFCLSAGRRVNRFLMDLLAFANRGSHWMKAVPEDMPRAMAESAAELSRPVLAGLQFRATGAAAADIYPVQPPHLYLDRPLVLYGKVPKETAAVGLQIVGWSGVASYDMVFRINLMEMPEGPAGIRQEWARQRIYDLLLEYVKRRDSGLLEQMRRTADQYGIVLPYALESP